MAAQIMASRTQKCCVARGVAHHRAAFAARPVAPNRLVHPAQHRASVRLESTAGPKSALEAKVADFDQIVLKEEKSLVLVDFWAPWCGPCRVISTALDEIAPLYQGKIKFVKVNTDDAGDIATKYSIRSIPTLIIFKQGSKLETIIGAIPKADLIKTIDKYLTAA